MADDVRELATASIARAIREAPMRATISADKVIDPTVPLTEGELLRGRAALEAAERLGWTPPATAAQCCMCGKKGLSTSEDGGPEAELADGRWVCSGDCYDLATAADTRKAALEGPEFDAMVERATIAHRRATGDTIAAMTVALRAALSGDTRKAALEEAAALIRCDCCDFCGEAPDFENVCANVLAARIELLAAGKPCSAADARAALAQSRGAPADAE